MRYRLVREALRAATSPSSSVALPRLATAFNKPTVLANPLCRTFTSSASVCKQNIENDSFVNGRLADLDSDAAMGEDLFNRDIVSRDSPTPAEDSVRCPHVARRPLAPVDGVIRPEFQEKLKEWKNDPYWRDNKRRLKPDLYQWNALCKMAINVEELEEALKGIRLYYARFGQPGFDTETSLAKRAVAIGYPEVAQNAFTNNRKYGLKINIRILGNLQLGLYDKVLRNDRTEIFMSTKAPGVPIPHYDLLGDANNSSFQPIDTKLARAQLSILDRMSLVASLVPKIRRQTQEMLLITLVFSGYLEMFCAPSSSTSFSSFSPLSFSSLSTPSFGSFPVGIAEKMDQLVAHLTRSIDALYEVFVYSLFIKKAYLKRLKIKKPINMNRGLHLKMTSLEKDLLFAHFYQALLFLLSNKDVSHDRIDYTLEMFLLHLDWVDAERNEAFMKAIKPFFPNGHIRKIHDKAIPKYKPKNPKRKKRKRTPLTNVPTNFVPF